MDLKILEIISVVFAIGCLGGVVSCLFPRPDPKEGQSIYQLWYKSKDCETYFPGLITNIILGGIAASAFWCLYGPYSGMAIIGTSTEDPGVKLTVGQIASSLFIGIGGVKYLQTEAERRCAEYQAKRRKSKNDDPCNG